jgi:bacterioferritin-associated ferredoxin
MCHCGVVTDRTIAAAIAGGAETLEGVCQATGAGKGCGGCRYSMAQLLCQHGVLDLSPPEVADEARQAAHS